MSNSFEEWISSDAGQAACDLASMNNGPSNIVSALRSAFQSGVVAGGEQMIAVRSEIDSSIRATSTTASE